MKVVAAGEFKQKCLKLMDEVRSKRVSVLITKKGEPVARLVPVDAQPETDVFGCLAERLEVLGDIEAPVVPPEDWGAHR